MVTPKNVKKVSLSQNSTLSKKSTVIADLYKSSEFRPKIIKILFNVLSSINIQRNVILDIVDKYKNSSSSDSKIINKLLTLKYNPINLYTEEYDIKKGFVKWRYIKKHLTKRIGSVLDMGGNVGTTAMVLGRKIFKLPRNKTFVVDIDEWANNKWTPRSDITYIHTDLMKTIPNDSIDLITCFHTLHHIQKKEYSKILKHFYRILSSDGCIAIYEHNCSSNEWAGIIDIEHALFDIVVSKKISYDIFVQKYHYAKYLSINNWAKLFEKVGFKKYFIQELHNKDQSFYIYFRKSDKNAG